MFSTPVVSSEMRDMEDVPGVAGCRSKSDANVTLGSRRVVEVVKSLVDVLGRGARPEEVTLKCTVLPLSLAAPADTGCTSAAKVSIPNFCKDCCFCLGVSNEGCWTCC